MTRNILCFNNHRKNTFFFDTENTDSIDENLHNPIPCFLFIKNNLLFLITFVINSVYSVRSVVKNINCQLSTFFVNHSK